MTITSLNNNITNAPQTPTTPLSTPNKKQRRGSVADLAAKFEQSFSEHTRLFDDEDSGIAVKKDGNDDEAPSTPTGRNRAAYSGASALLSYMTTVGESVTAGGGGLLSSPRSIINRDDDDNNHHHHQNKTINSLDTSSTHSSCSITKCPSVRRSPLRCSFSVQQQPQTATGGVVQKKKCRMCQEKIFPTDEITTSRHETYHVGCFKCSLCSSKMKNHPDDEHKLVGPPDGEQYMILLCSRCKIDNEQMNIPRRKSTVAGERIVVKEDEQGDIHNVVEAIGDDLEDAVWGMIPRCAICGGDFLLYDGSISIVGSLKYHKDCFLMGKPVGAGASQITLEPVLAAKYLPEHFIVKLSDGTGKAITTLFFVWKERESAIKTMRVERIKEVSLQFDLDEEARANPNYIGRSDTQRKSIALLPPRNDDDDDDANNLTLQLIGGDQVAPEPPKMVGSVTIKKGYQKPSHLQGTIGYSKYSLDHSLILNIPLNWKCDTLRLLGSTLTVQIHGRSK